MGKSLNIIMVMFLAISLSGCFKDLGNYDYTEINEVIIGDKGFDVPYNVRIDIDRLRITPEISFSKDKEGKGDYSYEWVAVGQNFHRGERFVIGTGRDLDYKVELAAEEYILYLKVKDNETDIVFSKSVGLNVRGLYSVGWLLAGEDENGKGQMDMISISGKDMMPLASVLKLQDGLSLSPINTIWIDNDQYTSDGRLYAGTPDGSYKFGREDFTGSPATDLINSFAVAPATGKTVMTDNQKVGDTRQVIVVDKRAYLVSTEGGMIYNTFSSYDQFSEFNTADKMICNHTGIQDIRTFIFYDLDARKFCYIKGLTVNNMFTQGDQEEDTWSWDTTKDFQERGLDFVTAFNSFFSGGQGAAILNDPATGDHYIYCLTAPRTGDPVKNGRYKVIPEATGFSDAAGYIITTNHGYMIYASGNTLYGYDFRKENPTVVKLHEFDAPVTCLKADYETSEKWNDIFYAATYNDDIARSGKVFKFQVEDNPSSIGISLEETWDKVEGDGNEGFLKIHSMYYKAF